MFKRLSLIAFFTGVGQLISVFAIKVVSQFLSAENMAAIAQVDTLIILIMNIIAFGLQSAAIRNIAISDNWRDKYKQTQSARLSLSLLVFVLGFLFFIKLEYAIFFLAPLLAINGDYALYAIGQPVSGAFFACLRLLIPYSLLIIGAQYLPEYANYIFFAAWAFAYVINDILVAKILGINISFKISWKDIRLYFQSLYLGIVAISFYFLGTGLILIVPYFYPPSIQASSFVGLKFYMLFKGILRIIHQAFVKEMQFDEWCFKIDQLSILIAIAYLSAIVFFPNSFVTLFFGKKYLDEKWFFIFLAFSAIVYSLISSAATRILLDKNDNLLARISFIAASFTIIGSIVLSTFNLKTLGIGISVLIGETFLMIGLAGISKIKNLIKTRLLFFASNIYILIIPFILRFISVDELKWCILSSVLVFAILILKNYRAFNVKNVNY